MALIHRMVFILLICLLPAAAAGDVVGLSDREVQAVADPVLDNILAGFKDANYESYSRDFDNTLKELISKEKFSQTRTQILDKLGNYKSRTYLGFLTKGKTTMVLWKGRFDKTGEDVLIRLALSRRGDRNLVLGLYFQ
ncbi:MAG: DUF3887 domain-containing protein [Deltaproteobacteria bacterium]|nr:MAG: DUF3887 domain-containing protein [Deltaproteobacteria bacterium]